MALLADTITPFLGATACFLFVLNAGIGWLEARLLRWKFHGHRWAVWWMIPANYASAWTGVFVLGGVVSPHIGRWLGDRPIERVNAVAVAVWGIALGITLVVEAPFVWLATDPGQRSFGRTAVATASVNAVSYLLVGLWFVLQSYSLPLNATVVSASQFAPPSAGTLYWVDAGGQVIARRFGSGAVADRVVGRTVKNDFTLPYMLIVERVDGTERLRLSAKYETVRHAGRPTPSGVAPPDPPTVLADVGPVTAIPVDYGQAASIPEREPFDLRQPGLRSVAVRLDDSRHTLDTAVPGGRSVHLVVGFGPVDWEVHDATVLPDDTVVFEWAGQIVRLDPRTARIAYLAAGTCPAFVPE